VAQTQSIKKNVTQAKGDITTVLKDTAIIARPDLTANLQDASTQLTLATSTSDLLNTDLQSKQAQIDDLTKDRNDLQERLNKWNNSWLYKVYVFFTTMEYLLPVLGIGLGAACFFCPGIILPVIHVLAAIASVVVNTLSNWFTFLAGLVKSAPATTPPPIPTTK